MSQTTHDRERAAAEAVANLHKGNRYEHWLTIADGLQAGREQAMAAAGVNRPHGNHYKAALKDWQTRNPWTHDKKKLPDLTVSNCYWLIDNLPQVEAWRLTLPDDERDNYNHPTTVRRHYENAQRAPSGGRSGHGGAPQGNPNRPTKAMLDALRQVVDVLQAENDQLRQENAQLKAQGGRLDGYARFPILGLGNEAFTDKQVTQLYRQLAKVFHADAGGSNEQMQRLNKERDAALKQATRSGGGGTGVTAP